MIDLTYEELLTIDGGAKKPCKCESAGRNVARIIKENVIWEGISSAWNEMVSWFD